MGVALLANHEPDDHFFSIDVCQERILPEAHRIPTVNGFDEGFLVQLAWPNLLEVALVLRLLNRVATPTGDSLHVECLEVVQGHLVSGYWLNSW